MGIKFLYNITNITIQFYSANLQFTNFTIIILIIQPIGDQREPHFIHRISLQLVSTGLIGILNQIDQFENEHIHWNVAEGYPLLFYSVIAYILNRSSSII